jgi:hypothetical protein
MKRYLMQFFVCTLLLLSCGKKLPPTSPDRWAPRVLNVQPIDKHHIRIFFSERLDSITPRKLVNYQIVDHEQAETTAIIYAERAKNGDEVLITIPVLEEKKYSLLMYRIKDLKGNMMKFAEKSFTPSTEQDTIAPLLKSTKPSQMLSSAPAESTIILTFTEPMDTGGVSLANFMQTNLLIDSTLVWNKTYTELTLHYRLQEGRMSRLFILPQLPDLSGNPLAEMRILSLTTNDTIPRNRLNIDIATGDSSLTNTYGFLSLRKDRLLHDVVWADSNRSFSLYFATPDTYFISIIAEHAEDTNAMWWGEETVAFYPDTTRSMSDTVMVSLVKRDALPHGLFSLYELLVKHVERKQ